MPKMKRAWVLYGITNGAVPRIAGVIAHRHREVACLLSETSPGDYRAEHLADVGWVGPRALRHERILERVHPVFPARFATLFSSPKAVEAAVDRHYPAIVEFLRTTQGREEWAVKVSVDRARALDAQPVPEVAGLSPGKRYVEQRRLRGEAERRLDARLDAESRTISRELDALGEARIRPSGERAYLVPRAGVKRFRAKVAKLHREHARSGWTIEASGPWPPYSFCPSLR